MRRFNASFRHSLLLGLIAAIALLALALATLPAQAAAAESDAARVIVKFKALGPLMRTARERGDRGPQHAATLAGRQGLSLRDGRMIDARSQVVWGDRGMTSAALAARLAKDADVEYAVPDERRHALATAALPNDPLLPAASGAALAAGQWYLQAPDATLVSAINAVGAWALTTGSAAIVVADVDTGVLPAHPDLANKLLPGYDFVSSTTTSGDGGGRDSDATDPGDWTTAGQCGTGQAATNSSWHGTETSGIIGAQTNNGVGMASVGYDVKVLPVRVLGKCGGTDSDIIAGMLWAAGLTNVPTANANPARVINLSLGGSGSCSAAYQDAINQLVAAGVTVVVAAGNSEGLAVGVPANCTGVITVAGVRHVGTKVGFSSIGAEVAIAAPGGNCVNTTGACLYPILTTTNSGTTTAGTHTYSSSANYSVGTSFAAPMVSGAAALMLSVNPSLKPAQLKSLLQSTARSFPAQPAGSSVPACRAPTSTVQDECYCTTSTCGAGLLDVGAAVAAAANAATPTASITASAATLTAGGSVTLDASASTAPGTRTITGWAWSLTSGAGIASFSGATTASTATLKTSGIGSVTVQLTVTDSLGQQATTTKTLVVTAPAAPTVGIVASASAVAAGTPVSFDGSSTKAATGFTIASYQWSVSAAPAGLASFTTATNAATAAVSTLGSSSGTVTVTLTVTDSLGQTGSASTTVTVTALGPTASISPSATTVTAGNNVVLDSTGSSAPAGRTLTGYAWSITSGSGIASFSGGTAGATATVATSAAGSFTVQLTLTDSAGAQAVKTQAITVVAAATTTSGSGGSSGGGGGGGGGAMAVGWLLGLLGAALMLGRRRNLFACA